MESNGASYDHSRDQGRGDQQECLNRLLMEVAALRRENNKLSQTVEELKAQVKPRRKLFKRDTDTECSDAVRRIYKELSQREATGEENFFQFDFTERFSSQQNQIVAKMILTEVRNVYGKEKWRKSTIQASTEVHWKSRRDDFTRRKSKSLEDHRAQAKLLARKKRKLENRRSALKDAPLTPSNKLKAEEVFQSPDALEYISTEESDNDGENVPPTNGPRPRKIKKLTWQRTKLRNLKAVLDEHYRSNLTPRQKRVAATVRPSNEVSPRPPPKGSPRWAVRQQATEEDTEQMAQ